MADDEDGCFRKSIQCLLEEPETLSVVFEEVCNLHMTRYVMQLFLVSLLIIKLLM